MSKSFLKKFSNFPLWQQILFISCLLSLVFGFCTAEIVRREESNYLLEQFKHHHLTIFSTFSNSCLESLIAEDTPVLKTLATQFIKDNSDVSYLKIENEENLILVERKNKESAAHYPTITHEIDIVYIGEKFGTISFELITDSIYNEINRHVQNIALFIVLIVILLTAIFLLEIHLLINRPIQELYRKLTLIAKDKKPSSDVKMSSRELLRFNKAIDELYDVIQLIKQREDELRQTTVSKEYVDNIFKRMTDILIVIDDDFKIKLINEAGCVSLGYKRDELIGVHIATILTDQIVINDRLKETSVMKESFLGLETTYRSKKGHYIPILLSGARLADKNQQLDEVLLIATDITEIKNVQVNLEKAYDELKDTRDQLIYAEKMASVGRLAAGVAHEVKNPLMMIMQNVEFVSKKMSSKDKNLDLAFNNTFTAIHRADAVIRGLLDFSSLADLQIEKCDINDIIKDTLVLVKHHLDKGKVQLKLELLENIPKLNVDKTKIQQVLINLMENAIQAMPEGGAMTTKSYVRKISVGDECLKNQEGHIFSPNEKAVFVEIHDTGQGIQNKIMTKVFEPFVTTKGSEGTGLGLSITKSIIEQHGGHIYLKDLDSKGAKATIMFKIAEQ